MTDNCEAIRADHAVGDTARVMRETDVGMLSLSDLARHAPTRTLSGDVLTEVSHPH